MTAAGRLEIVTIGTELLLGETLDGNAAWLGRRLAAEGLRVTRRTTVDDAADAIAEAVSGALERTGTVLCTGGLGPTPDDVTRPAVAALYGRELVLDDAWLEVVRERFRVRGRTMPEINRNQAEVPEGGRLLPNPDGTAPGIVLEDDRLGLTVLLPGVPREMRGLTETHVIPLLSERLGGGHAPISSRTVRTTGISESALAERIADLPATFAPLTVAYLPSGTGEDVRVTSWGELPAAEAEARLSAAVASLKETLAPWAYGTDTDDLAALAGNELRRRGWTLALAESCTGGLLSKRISDFPGASDFFLAGVVAYGNAAKHALAGVRPETLAAHGAVSEAVAIELAAGACRVTGADCALSITGVAGPGGGTPDKPVGLVWIGLALAGATSARKVRLAGDRAEIRERAAQAALALLWKTLRDPP